MKTRVLKIGGSLLRRPALLDDLWHFYQTVQQERPAEKTLAIVGGGEMIEAVRQWDRIWPDDPADVHWRCVEMLRFSYLLLATAMRAHPRFGDPQFCRFDTVSDSLRDEVSVGEFTLVNVPAFYGPTRPCDWLPLDWSTTTDAIAIRLAELTGARECLLLKSCKIASAGNRQDWISLGIIDAACAHSPENQAFRPIQLLQEQDPLGAQH